MVGVYALKRGPITSCASVHLVARVGDALRELGACVGSNNNHSQVARAFEKVVKDLASYCVNLFTVLST